MDKRVFRVMQTPSVMQAFGPWWVYISLTTCNYGADVPVEFQ